MHNRASFAGAKVSNFSGSSLIVVFEQFVLFVKMEIA